ncbi:hypothetical protein A2686_03035 [Candidatus Woesebacteria bacterium RIFCSPHIGHO2_01_FULL_38_10]|uniref:GxxExxY protein n=1 Tax=Candidatus Woesebacteria bacterium RIFCSPLOWO2_01_FULL_39_10b TaxID=1802517 RepID=A0A1F8B7V0_9BACT|nr:MAG: hypothetical protein A2686_03035 [Candidatus Woesebacteria bacterium RIFCSPHIGHO2_01_FULL_38_10]OGM60122.1 MAG: hypothetical protein A2892_00850 [Candidatus Woesebacteria bacterium RIFCSPLOWO2_01_FULL_39_10b]
MAKLVYPELGYKIIGALFEVYNRLGNGYKEKYYQRALEQQLKEIGLSYKRELQVNLTFRNQKIGKYFLDFLVENKVVLELKTKPRFTYEDFRQVSSYLRVNKLKLGILVNFRGEKLIYKRILNLEIRIY